MRLHRYITVSNLDDMAATLDGYSIRATCLPAAKVPCARPFPSLGSCSLPVTASQQDEAQTCLQVSELLWAGGGWTGSAGEGNLGCAD